MNDKSTPIKRARELLQTVKHVAAATVNEDGTPHNSPLLFLYNSTLTKLFWGSHPASLHSQNIVRTGQLFVVVYDAFERGGLYIKAENGHITEGQELEEALEVHNKFRRKAGKPPLQKNYYEGEAPQRMWAADITGLWVNDVERNENGRIAKDYRHEVTAKDVVS